jgi:hypothetical protein
MYIYAFACPEFAGLSANESVFCSPASTVCDDVINAGTKDAVGELFTVREIEAWLPDWIEVSVSSDRVFRVTPAEATPDARRHIR